MVKAYKMPYEFHQDRNKYFKYQKETTKNYIIPYIQSHCPITDQINVLEIGCGEGGVLQAFLDYDSKCYGVELNREKYDMASNLMSRFIEKGRLILIHKNIYDESFKKSFQFKFQIIILKDVVEHIPDQKKLMAYLHTFLKPGGVIFISFPPWQMPFGGHQQMCRSFLKKTPWFHLLPMPIFKTILSLIKEPALVTNSLIANKKTGISVERFEKILKMHHYKILKKTFYLFNPIYKYKFNLEPREQFPIIKNLIYIRNYVTTAMYYLIQH
jgi:2-polyprenyl-3-methyl-5-hydroxy-6-metoxy-1,4-benzoquinol methylase